MASDEQAPEERDASRVREVAGGSGFACPGCGKPLVEDGNCFRCDRCERMWPISFFNVDEMFIRFMFTKWEYARVAKLVNERILEIQTDREKRTEAIDLETMKQKHPRLMQLMDKLLYGGEDLSAFAEYKRKVKELNENAYANENAACSKCLTNPCHCDVAELN